MSTHPNGLRDLARDTSATGLYFMAWFGLALGLLLLIVAGVTALRTREAGETDSLAFGFGVLGVVFVLMGFINRWLAKGVLLLRRGMIAAACVYTALCAAFYLLVPTYDGSPSSIVMYRTLGGIFVFSAALLAWLLVAAKAKNQAQDGEA